MICQNCPRRCNLNYKYCKAPENLKIDIYQAHFGEEPCISGKRGSGTIFFSHCNLSCIFCQNYQISQLNKGKIISDNEFINICWELKKRKVHNINLVSPTCYHQKLQKLLKELKKQKFPLPFVWNSNAYEKVENIKGLEGLIDIYLPDFKYSDNNLAIKYSNAPNYFDIAKRAISEMASQQKKLEFDENGVILKGIIIRHLILPNCLNNSKKVLKWLKENIGKDVYLSLMSQYTPVFKAHQFPEINRPLKKEEYDEICNYCFDLGFKNVYTQNLLSAREKYIPSF